MNTKEIAELLNISRMDVRALIRNGKLKGEMETKRDGYQVDESEVKRYIDENHLKIEDPTKGPLYNEMKQSSREMIASFANEIVAEVERSTKSQFERIRNYNEVDMMYFIRFIREDGDFLDAMSDNEMMAWLTKRQYTPNINKIEEILVRVRHAK